MTVNLRQLQATRHPEQASVVPPPPKPRPMKARRPETTKAAALEALSHFGLSRFMELTGLGKTRAYATTDEAEGDAHLQVRHAAALTVAGCPAFVEFFARLHGGTYLPPDGAAPPVPAHVHVAGIARYAGELMAEAMGALADGAIDQREAVEILHDWRALNDRLDAFRGLLLKQANIQPGE